MGLFSLDTVGKGRRRRVSEGGREGTKNERTSDEAALPFLEITILTSSCSLCIHPLVSYLKKASL